VGEAGKWELGICFVADRKFEKIVTGFGDLRGDESRFDLGGLE
jgi:hypothetical protein